MIEVPGSIDRRQLGANPFSAELCDTLFAAILIDDEVDDETRLPATIQLDYSADELAACFGLCRQLWYSGFDRDMLLELVARLARDRDLGDEDRVRLKHVRAKFKHFRFAHALYDVDHAYPRLLDRITITMGHLQDAYRHGRRTVVLREALLLRALLTRWPLRRLYREADQVTLAPPSDFRRLLEQDYRALASLEAQPSVTGHLFHVTRKVVGRQVSFWDALRTIEPTPERYAMSRSLSAINGLMGRMHDELVERKSQDRASYGQSFALPTEIRARIAALVATARA